ncbi:DUF6889 family protein [Desulfosporosinus fructosivorans]
MAGMWQQHEVWDGTYTLDDLANAHEMLAVKAENERRANEAGREERQ